MAYNGYKQLTDWFDRIYVINRPDREQRLKSFLNDIEESNLADPEDIVVYPAIMGNRTSFPSYFQAGAGAWGCLRSHIRIIEDVIMEQNILNKTIGSILILEDDAEFIPEALPMLNAFMHNVPTNWDQIYLGGQHRREPEHIGIQRVMRAMSVNRTHAYALKRKIYKKVYVHLNHAPDYMGRQNHHVDHQYEVAHRRKDWNVYCPATWLAAQKEGRSDICDQDLGHRIWE